MRNATFFELMLKTMNGMMNKMLIDDYIITRKEDGHILSIIEIQKLTSSVFGLSSIEVSEIDFPDYDIAIEKTNQTPSKSLSEFLASMVGKDRPKK